MTELSPTARHDPTGRRVVLKRKDLPELGKKKAIEHEGERPHAPPTGPRAPNHRVVCHLQGRVCRAGHAGVAAAALCRHPTKTSFCDSAAAAAAAAPARGDVLRLGASHGSQLQSLCKKANATVS